MSRGSCLFIESALHPLASPLRSLYLQIFRACNTRTNFPWTICLCQDVLLLILWTFFVNKLILVFFFFPLHQIPPGYTVSTAVDSGGRGAHARRSDCSGSAGGTYIRCPSLIPSGPLRTSPPIHDSKSRQRLLGPSSNDCQHMSNAQFFSICVFFFFFNPLCNIIYSLP